MLQYLKNKPSITYTLIILNIVMYIVMTLFGGTENIANLVRFGAKYSPYIINGQYWRLITPMFIHIGLQHLLINMITLYFLGTLLENIFGKIRFLIIYLVSGICGNIASFAFNFSSISAGASTALFGMFGSFLMLGESFRRNPYLQTMSRQFFLLVILNIFFGMFGNSDLTGHLGGLVSGFLLGYVVGVPNLGRVPKVKRIVSFVILLFINLIILNFGFTS
ncbi:rhomboid family intramembrane serine protease [Ligilactobacillus salivarius]|uniref:rhomboid family intramembrane serine protease n=1 Tax=Ligilactobacillus salivarius TaxID=1624 RepID=UPI0031FE7C75